MPGEDQNSPREKEDEIRAFGSVNSGQLKRAGEIGLLAPSLEDPDKAVLNVSSSPEARQNSVQELIHHHWATSIARLLSTP